MGKKLIKAIKSINNYHRGVAWGLEGFIAKMIRLNIKKKDKPYGFSRKVKL